jgi:dienelactone hydrolase
MRCVASLTVSLTLATTAHAQTTRDVKVANPTRLDWAFAAQGFGPGAGKLPADFDSTQQKYQLFVPKKYKADKTTAWPLVVFISPGDTPTGLAAWRPVCEKHGVLFCSPYKAGNNVPPGQRTRIVLDMLDDVRRNHRIDPDQTYISGFSGGGRMSCAIGFALPECFGGIVPVCGTNPIVGPTYLRHRAQDRLSVAYLTGEKDFNRKENEEAQYPYAQELEIRSMLKVVPKLAHAIPGSDVMEETYNWLLEDLKRRKADVKVRPELTFAAEEAPTGAEQAQRFVTAARKELKIADRTWRGVALLQGAAARWPKIDAGQTAKKMLQSVLSDEELIERIAKQGADDEIKFVSAQATSLERMGQTNRAIEAWEILVKNYPDAPVAKKAKERIAKLKGEKS